MTINLAPDKEGIKFKDYYQKSQNSASQREWVGEGE